MRTQELKDFINEHSALFWYSPEPKEKTVTDELLVETILNYGDTEAVKQLFAVFGLRNVADIFRSFTGQSERCKGNYFPPVYNYFNLYFNRYAP